MPKVTTKGQITIPQDIRNRFGFLPGIEVDIIDKDNKALIVKSTRENVFLKWLGRGKLRKKKILTLWLINFVVQLMNSIIVDTNPWFIFITQSLISEKIMLPYWESCSERIF